MAGKNSNSKAFVPPQAKAAEDKTQESDVKTEATQSNDETKTQDSSAPPAATNDGAGDPPRVEEDDPPVRRRARLVNFTPETGEGPEHEEDPDDEEIGVLCPRGYRLMLDNGITIQYVAGTQHMPRSHAEHWYSKAFGVQIVE